MAEREQDEDYIEINIPREEESVATETAKEEPKPKPKKKKVAKKKKAAKKPITPTKKKTTKKRAPAKQPASSNWLWAALLIIGLVVIAAVIYLSLQGEGEEKQEQESEKRVAALVNNQALYWEEIEEIYASLPPNIQGQVDEEVIREQLIEQELLLQEAKKEGIVITDEDIDAYTQELLASFGMDEEMLDSTLALQGMSREAFDENNRKQLTVSELVNRTVYSKIIVTDEDIEARYEAGKEQFAVPELAIVRHILLVPEENESEEDFDARVEDVRDMIEDDFSNVCDLVEEYSQDPGSIANCGEYQVAQNGQFVPEFEAAAFEMAVGDITIVATEYGQHIMVKDAQTEAGTLPLEDVRADLEALIIQEEGSLQVRAYIDSLRDDATIEKYQKDADVPEETAPQTSDEEEEQEEEVQVEVEETKPVREGNFGKCLEEAGAILYGLSWAPDVAEQMEILGEASEEVNYIDCEADDAPLRCNDIAVWPTWIIDNKIVQGKQTLNALARETGCTP